MPPYIIENNSPLRRATDMYEVEPNGKIKAFLRRKDIIFSAKRYFIDAMGAMAQGLFCTLLVGTILNTIGQQFHIGFLNAVIVTLGKGDGAVSYTIGGLCSAMVGPGMARGHRRCAEGAAAGAVLPDPRGLCRQLYGRRRRPAGPCCSWRCSLRR